MEFNLIVDLGSVEHPGILKILSETSTWRFYMDN